MADTYTQLYYHVVFAVRNRESLITQKIKTDLYRYITGIVKGQHQFLVAINGMPDHIHLLLSCKPDIKLSDLVKEIKEHSNKFINESGHLHGRFYWQAGYGAFSVSKSESARVIEYIKGQEEHHKKSTFRQEYLKMLHENEVMYMEKYVFDFELNE